MNIKEEFSKYNIINNLAKYEIYYQVSMRKMITDTKVNVDIDVDFKNALGSIYELLKDLKEMPDAKRIYEMELLKQASMDAVQYFINENMSMVKEGNLEVEPIINKINDNEFFDKEMKDLCKRNMINQMMKWHEFVTDEVADSISNSLHELERVSN
ncbi:MAG: hypothetical protein ACNI3C_12445 [Candidatus Marinarcus sp.]|uniref:hypothetical protein n=1 Tax=Candidatus Marinarcus sp. TaxID=3100987 RepID=UPI003B00EF13